MRVNGWSRLHFSKAMYWYDTPDLRELLNRTILDEFCHAEGRDVVPSWASWYEVECWAILEATAVSISSVVVNS